MGHGRNVFLRRRNLEKILFCNRQKLPTELNFNGGSWLAIPMLFSDGRIMKCQFPFMEGLWKAMLVIFIFLQTGHGSSFFFTVMNSTRTFRRLRYAVQQWTETISSNFGWMEMKVTLLFDTQENDWPWTSVSVLANYTTWKCQFLWTVKPRFFSYKWIQKEAFSKKAVPGYSTFQCWTGLERGIYQVILATWTFRNLNICNECGEVFARTKKKK